MKFWHIWDLLNVFIRDTEKYRRIKASDKASESVYFGVKSILCSVVGVAAGIGLAAGGFFLLGSIQGSGNVIGVILLAIFGVSAIIGGGACLLMCAIRSITTAILQIKLNRKPIGKAALIVGILIILAMVAVALVIVLR